MPSTCGPRSALPKPLQYSPDMATTQNNVGIVVRHRECLRNLRDGCTGFQPSGEDGTPESVFCAVCRCHRKFHRAEEIMQVVTPIRHPSAPAPAPALPAAPTPPVVRVYTRRGTHRAPPPQAAKDEGEKEKGKKAAAGKSVKKGKRRRLILTAELEERLARKSVT
ncbi:hypothetical protein RJ639_037562 [Escallonia herrerae]|uniref:ZF-HD dimerization-type domain-containing protein n=1 Tax=Escallonia herrerae TaxID=1293975 RepID=A0AA89B6G0_9ASTE|nr:hypothetical protein RJ639_037562 [Escallonia herrerae]